MIRSSRGGKVPRRVLIAVAAMLVPMIAGCEAGANAPSLHWHPPTDGTNATVGNITISNAFVLGAPIGAKLRAGQNAGLFLGLVNTGTPDRLIAISAPIATSVRLVSGGVTLLANHSVLLTGPRPAVVLQDLTHRISGGSVVTIFLRFAKAGIIRLRVPVMPRVQYYTTLSQAPKPTPTGTAASPSPSVSSPAG